MIVPMKKVSLVVLDKDREASLKKLREIGVVHLEKKSASSENLSRLLDRKAKLENALGIVNSYDTGKKKKTKVPAAPPADGNRVADGTDIVTQVLKYADDRKYLQDQLAYHGRERSSIEDWGNFNP